MISLFVGELCLTFSIVPLHFSSQMHPPSPSTKPKRPYGILLLCIGVGLGASCPQPGSTSSPAPTPPQIIARPPLRATEGPRVNNPPQPQESTDILRWEGETGYYYTSHTGGA